MHKKWIQLGLLDCLGLFQGMAFAILPSASVILTSSDYYQLSNSLYGLLFLPFFLASILALIYSEILKRKQGAKPSLAFGIIINALAMLFLALTNVAPNKFPIIFSILLGVAGGLGLGFGATLTSLNALILKVMPENTDIGLKSLYVSLGIGMAASPLMLAYFIERDLWWLTPICIFVGFLLLFNFAIFIPVLPFVKDESLQHKGIFNVPWTFWLFFALFLLYGFCETALANWIPLYLHQVKKLSVIDATQALVVFWGMVTAGRIGIGFVTHWISFRWFYWLLPLMLFWILDVIPLLVSVPDLTICCGIAGLACSAFFPMSLEFGKKILPQDSVLVLGGLITAYMTGYGLGSFGLSELQTLHKIPLEAIYPFTALPASFMTILAWCILYFFPRKKTESAEV